MVAFPPALQKLIRELSKLPSIGEKTATRLAYHLAANDRNLARTLADALTQAVQHIRLCDKCFFMSEEELCSICRNPARDTSLLCIVEKPVDLIAIERVGEFRGVYHVLHGLWAPLRGQGPESMKIKELLTRVSLAQESPEPFKEAIVATSATVEGDATAMYVARILQEYGLRATRPAQGMPKGGEFEYADDVTLSRAFAGRSVVDV